MTERTLLIEIGTEELPPRSLRRLSDDFARAISDQLQRQGLEGAAVKPFCSPRRLAVVAEQVPARQPDRRVTRKGPAVKAAFDEQGNPTRAAEGFARSCGVGVAELERETTGKGEWLMFRRDEPGKAASDVVAQVTRDALGALQLPKRMRWADSEIEFVRPVHWVVMMLDDEIVEAEILGVTSGGITFGHRYHARAPLPVPHAGDYAQLLESKGKVIADFAVRRDRIASLVQAAAAEAGARAISNDDLLDEVTALVEWPVAVRGSFEADYLRVPAEALISTMQGNQKYFPLQNDEGELIPGFITIANLESSDPDKVREGNERVVRPRLADAGFFWDQDRRSTLASRCPALADVLFQQKLGSVADKCRRVANLAGQLAGDVGGDVRTIARAAALAKCDLLTAMVGEFPELQGVMGRHYALHDGEDEAVADALQEQYLPRFAGDDIAATPAGRALALAERLDTLAGIFCAGQRPTGEKDPYALRRAALGVMRTLIEGEITVDLPALLAHAVSLQPLEGNDTLVADLQEFMLERLRAYYQSRDVGGAHFDAVLARSPRSPLDFDRRLAAVTAFTELPESSSLAAANKRISNILRQAEDTDGELDESGLDSPPEVELARQLAALEADVRPLLAQHDYTRALNRMASLREAIDRFFDDVMVMVEDPALRRNRLALLRRVNTLFLEVADVSLLPGET